MPQKRLGARPESNSSHLAGEYFVAAELYKRGFSVALTMGNAKAIDLFAEKRTRTVNVQVKAIRIRRNVGWPIMIAKVLAGVVYVFVCLNEHDEALSYFITPLCPARCPLPVSRVRDAGHCELRQKASQHLSVQGPMGQDRAGVAAPLKPRAIQQRLEADEARRWARLPRATR